MDGRSLEESVYLYIAHKVESLYRFILVVTVEMLHTFTLVYLGVVQAFLHACSNNTRPVSALSFLKLTVVSSNAFHLFTCRVSTLWPACQLAFILMWLHTQLCCLSLLMWKWPRWQLFRLLIGLAVFLNIYNMNGTRIRRGKCLQCHQVPGTSLVEIGAFCIWNWHSVTGAGYFWL